MSDTLEFVQTSDEYVDYEQVVVTEGGYDAGPRLIHRVTLVLSRPGGALVDAYQSFRLVGTDDRDISSWDGYTESWHVVAALAQMTGYTFANAEPTTDEHRGSRA